MSHRAIVRRVAIVCALVLPAASSSGAAAEASGGGGAPSGEVGADLDVELAEARARVEAFFGQPFARPFEVRVFPDRRALDAHWRETWQVPDLQSECWMVASGTGSELALLAPAAWKTEACEHDAADAGHLRRLLAHELTHVFHGQHNPRPDFDGLDAIAWFAEGLAVHVSGQLDAGELASPREAVERGLAPAELATAWSGKYRYGVCGSLVRFVDSRLGRAKLLGLLAATSEGELLAAIGLDEGELLEAWRRSVVAAP